MSSGILPETQTRKHVKYFNKNDHPPSRFPGYEGDRYITQILVNNSSR